MSGKDWVDSSACMGMKLVTHVYMFGRVSCLEGLSQAA